MNLAVDADVDADVAVDVDVDAADVAPLAPADRAVDADLAILDASRLPVRLGAPVRSRPGSVYVVCWRLGVGHLLSIVDSYHMGLTSI